MNVSFTPKEIKVVKSALESYIYSKEGAFFDEAYNCDGLKGKDFKQVLDKILAIKINPTKKGRSD